MAWPKNRQYSLNCRKVLVEVKESVNKKESDYFSRRQMSMQHTGENDKKKKLIPFLF